MSFNDLIPVLAELPRCDKFRVMQFLTAELAQEEGQLIDGTAYPVYSPYDAHEAAATLALYLHEQTGKP